MSIACAAAFAGTVYKWVDEDGVIHYSDQPHENAEKVQVAAPQTYTPQRSNSPGIRPPSSGPTSNTTAKTYQSCDVVAPTNEQTFPNAESVSAAVQVSPGPRSSDRVLLLMDGAPVPNFPPGGGSVIITPIERGTHSLQAVVQSSDGKVLCQSPSVTFSVTQPSVLNPNNPNGRH